MAIQGSGTSSDPYIVTNYDDLVSTINTYPQNGGTKHIAFPAIYDGPKVMDMRDRGWLPKLSANPPSTTSNPVSLYLHCNGWTILGLSCMSNSWWDTSNNEPRCNHVTIDDLIIKNFYLLSTTNTEIALFQHSTGIEGSKLTLNRCKISGCLDAMQNYVDIEMYAYNNKPFYANSCSFNVKFINHNNLAGFNRHYSNDSTMDFFYNCIFNITDQNNNDIDERGNDYWDYLLHGEMYFCKVVGFIKRNPNHRTGSGYYYFIKPKTPSCYNVFDFEVIDMYKRLWIDDQEGYMFGIYNKDKTTVGGIDMFNPWQPNYFRGLTSAQMVDKDYLNSIDFICGDAPSS